MHRTHIACLLALVVISFPLISFAILKPFGGNITSTLECDEGMLLTIKEPLKGIGNYMWYWGELPYLMYSIPHIRQNLIGMATQISGTCTIDGETIGSGSVILYHGESY